MPAGLSINASTPRDLIGTAFLAYDANLMAQIADVLGKSDDAAKYRKLFEDTKAAFGARFLFGSQLPAVPAPASEIRKQMGRIAAAYRKRRDWSILHRGRRYQILLKAYNNEL